MSLEEMCGKSCALWFDWIGIAFLILIAGFFAVWIYNDFIRDYKKRREEKDINYVARS